MWQTMLLPTLTSVTGSWLIIFAFWFYNRKKQSDAKENEYARLVNGIVNLNDKFDNLNNRIDNEAEARNNHYTRLENEIANLNDKFDNGNDKFNNGFERFFIEIDKLRTDVEANTQKIDFLTSAVNTNIKNTQDLMNVVVELQNIVHESIK